MALDLARSCPCGHIQSDTCKPLSSFLCSHPGLTLLKTFIQSLMWGRARWWTIRNMAKLGTSGIWEVGVRNRLWLASPGAFNDWLYLSSQMPGSGKTPVLFPSLSNSLTQLLPAISFAALSIHFPTCSLWAASTPASSKMHHCMTLKCKKHGRRAVWLRTGDGTIFLECCLTLYVSSSAWGHTGTRRSPSSLSTYGIYMTCVCSTLIIWFK